jgi:hypothetical protein
MKMNKNIIINENGSKATYTWKKESDSQGYHIKYSGPRGTFMTTHLGFKSVLKDILRKGYQVIESNIANIEQLIFDAKFDLAYEKELNEKWQREHGESCVLI